MYNAIPKTKVKLTGTKKILFSNQEKSIMPNHLPPLL